MKTSLSTERVLALQQLLGIGKLCAECDGGRSDSQII